MRSDPDLRGVEVVVRVGVKETTMKMYAAIEGDDGRLATTKLTDAQVMAVTALLGNVVALRAIHPAAMIEERKKAVAHVGFHRNQRPDRRAGH